MKKIIYKHYWDDCSLCGRTVICGKCGNNCCNGRYGELPDGKKCDVCPSAYIIYLNGENGD